VLTNSGASIFYSGKNAIMLRVFKSPHSKLGDPLRTDAPATATTVALEAVLADAAASASEAEVTSYILVNPV
jgi:hypothetical protein